MINRNKRRLARFPVILAIALIGVNAMQFLSMGFFVDTYASLHYANQTMGVAVDLTNVVHDLGYWTILLAVWLAIIQTVILFYVNDKMDEWLKRKWPDLKVRPTKRSLYKRGSA